MNGLVKQVIVVSVGAQRTLKSCVVKHSCQNAIIFIDILDNVIFQNERVFAHLGKAANS